jgi:hypothetical protein
VPPPESPERQPPPSRDVGRQITDLTAELDDDQRDRLLRAALAMAEAAVAPRVAQAADNGEPAALAALRAWLADPSPVTLAGVQAELEADDGSWYVDPYLPKLDVVFDCLRAVERNDLDYALRTGVRTIAEAARLDPDARRTDPRRGPLVARVRARRSAEEALLFAGRLIRAGADPLPPAPPGPMLRPGEDPFEALRKTLPVADCRRAGQVDWLRLRMLPGERAAYLAGLRAAIAEPSIDDERLPGIAEHLLSQHAGQALRRWQAALWVPPFPAPHIPDGPDGRAPTTEELADGFRTYTAEGRELIWAHGLRTATEWLAAVREGGGHHAYARTTDEAVRELARHRPQDPAGAGDCARDLERAMRHIARERVARWHVDLAAAACEGRAPAALSPFPVVEAGR